jgi:hypothetical protein
MLLYEILLSSSAAGIPEKYSKILTLFDFKPLSMKHNVHVVHDTELQ